MKHGLVRMLVLASLVTSGLCGIGTSRHDAGAPPGQRGFQLQGAASCASAACHNANDPPGTLGSEYTTWVTRDPHARAFEVLFSTRSKGIERNIKHLKRIEDAHAERDSLCLKCHTTNEPGPPRESFSLEDGVGCESCHGPAEKWLTQHYRWRGRSDADKETLGFRLTGRDLVRRAATCVPCHVGAPDREVNHDLIAAGHPPLRFEFGAYHANLPKHWNVGRDKEGRLDFEVLAWAVGQVVTARAALELLSHRAAVGKTWPEFAEYECFSCHHELGEPSWRQERGYSARKAGSPAWGTWYFSGMLGEALALGKETGASEVLRKLHEVMQTPTPDRTDVLRLARTAAGQLEPRGLARSISTPAGASTLEERLARVEHGGKGPAEATWDEAAQRYLALAALQNAFSDQGRKSPPLAVHLRALRKDLRFPEGFDSPRDFDPFRVKSSK
jgi:hypothetical protein